MRSVRTRNREIYEKFRLLNISNSVKVSGVREFQLRKVVNNVNFGGRVLDFRRVGGGFKVVRLSGERFRVYLKKC